MKAVDLGCSDENLIGDFSRACSLETVKGKCQDLKYITPETVTHVYCHSKYTISSRSHILDRTVGVVVRRY